MRSFTHLCAALLVLVMSASVALAHPDGFDLDWWTIDGGGAVHEAGYFLLSAAGQAEAAPPLTGGGYALTGGFYVGDVTIGPTATPTPNPTPTSTPPPSGTPTPTRFPTATPTVTRTTAPGSRVFLPMIIQKPLQAYRTVEPAQ